MFLVYNFAAALALVLSAPWWLLKLARGQKYRAGLGERLGWVPSRLARDQRPCAWIHAVSVGEVLAIGGLVGGLRVQFPELRLVISTTTATGQKLACERFGEENVFYFPLDFSFAIRPYLRRLRPRWIILAETEFWPNFMRLAKQQGARIAVVNARISDRSLSGYRRWRRWMRRVLATVDLFLAQSPEDAQRLVSIGAPAERVQVSGNLKFEIKPPPQPAIVRELKQRLAQAAAGPVLVCGSTMEGEEPPLLEAFAQILSAHPRALLVLAPRHPERFDSVAALVQASPKQLPLWRRSQLPAEMQLAGGVLLLDSIGELAAIYSLATVAFVGGSLVTRGGHNILEPAYFGVPIVVGPHTENFRDIVRTFAHANAVRVVTREGLICELLALLANAPEREQLGRRAAEVLREQNGANGRTLAALSPLLAAPNKPTELVEAAQRR